MNSMCPQVLACADGPSLAQIEEALSTGIIVMPVGCDLLPDAAREMLVGCVVLDTSLPRLDAHQLLKELHETVLGIPIIALTRQEKIESVMRLVKAGADEVLHKPELTPKRLAEVINAAILKSVILQAERNEIRDIERRYASLSEKEREVVDLVAQGMTNRDIADKLGLSIRAVENRRRPALAKMGATTGSTGTQLALMVQRMWHAKVRDWSKTSP